MDLDQEISEKIEEQSVEHSTSEEERASTEKMTEGFLKQTSREFKTWISDWEKIESPELKIKECLVFMRDKLSSTPSPKFREFWDVRKLCLSLFKENLPTKTRADLWQQYIDLSIEARRLKGILDERSMFACEQIELAIRSLELDLDAYQDRLMQIPEGTFHLDLEPFCRKKEYYNSTQRELHLLNALAAKVNSLRKESIKTEMRVRSKNKIFEKLSSCGDRIFPRRKELVLSISQQFLEDVSLFKSLYFKESTQIPLSLQNLREAVKSLQSLAKFLTLNAHSFNETRTILAFCWDQLKSWDKERKKESQEQRLAHKKAYEDAMEKVKEFETFCLEASSGPSVFAKFEEVFQGVKELKPLRNFELKQIREMLFAAKKPWEDKLAQERQFLQMQHEQKQQERSKLLESWKADVLNLLNEASHLSWEEFSSRKIALEEQVSKLSSTKSEKIELGSLVKKMKDCLLELKSKRILASSDRLKYLDLQSLLKEKQERKEEIKLQIEEYRKILGSSGFDFEKAMMYRELIESEKEVLIKISAAIEELEEKMSEIEG